MQSDTLLPQTYRDAYAFAAAHGVIGVDETWRLTERVLGEIKGLPGSRGVLTATNGIYCYVERGDNIPFYGHVQWFTPDDGEGVAAVVERALGGEGAKPRKTKRQQSLDEYE